MRATSPEIIALSREAQNQIRAIYREDFKRRNELMKVSPWGVMQHGSPALQRRLRDAAYLMSEIRLALNLKTEGAQRSRLTKLIASLR